MRKIPVILDGDPGHDDAIAWMIAAASPLLEIKAVTTVAGNKDINHVTENAAKLCHLFHIQAPLARGAAGPLVVAGTTAGNFHGETGLDGVELPVNGVPLSELSAVELMAKVLEKSEDPVVIIGTGAETNLAALLLYRPDLKGKIRAFHIMGGGIEVGNWNPAAEFNILVDPEAAKIVFSSGVPIVMSGLDVTEKALIYPEEIESIRSLGTPLSHIVGCWLDFFGSTHRAFGYTGWPLHDPCAVLSLTSPELFTMKDAYLQIDTSGGFARGATLADFEDINRFNARVVLDVDRKAFVETIEDVVRSYGDFCSHKDCIEAGSTASRKTEKSPVAEMLRNTVLVLPSDTPDTLREKIAKDAPCCLVLSEGALTSALTFKVWPELSRFVDRFIYAGGTLGRGDATPWAESSVYQSPESVESLLNTGIPVVFATLEAAKARAVTPQALALDYAEHPQKYETASCGIHVEFHPDSPAKGKLVCDLASDHKFEKKNALLIL